VAWISERKDVLSTFFWLLTMGAYHLYVKRPGIGWYLLTLLLFAMGLMAKPMLVTLPFVLLLLDYWPLNRMKFAGDSGKTKSIWRLIIEKLPFFALSVISSVVTFIVQRSGGAVSAIETFGIKVRIFNALTSYIGYIQKIFWPSGLAALYPHPGGTVSMSKAVICAVVLVLISICFLVFGRRRKYLAVGWLWYLGTLVPVIGLVQVGAQAMADRYTYVPLTGLFIIFAWAARETAIKWPRSKTMIAPAALAVLAAAIVCTTVQLKYWQNSTTLFERTLAVTKDNYLMQSNYGNTLKNSGRVDEAIEHFNEALRLSPNNPEVHNNLGNALVDKSQIQQAIEHYQKAIELTKDKRMGGNLQAGFGQAHYNFANALKKQGRFEEAIKHYEHTIRITPDDVYAYNNLGLCLTELNKLDEAVEYYRKAIEIKPDFALAHGWLGLALARLGKTDEAAREIQLVLKQRPDDTEMHCNLGIILERQGKTEEAIAHYRRALEINANYTKARNLLDTVLAKKQSR
jgi:tetratricopeptide (TPR) repeat protein